MKKVCLSVLLGVIGLCALRMLAGTPPPPAPTPDPSTNSVPVVPAQS